MTQSTSDLSTVEHVRPHRPMGTGRANKKANSSNDGELLFFPMIIFKCALSNEEDGA